MIATLSFFGLLEVLVDIGDIEEAAPGLCIIYPSKSFDELICILTSLKAKYFQICFLVVAGDLCQKVDFENLLVFLFNYLFQRFDSVVIMFQLHV